MKSGTWFRACLRPCTCSPLKRVTRTPVFTHTPSYSTLNIGKEVEQNPIFSNSELLKPRLDYDVITNELSSKIKNAVARRACIRSSLVPIIPYIHNRYKDHQRSIQAMRRKQRQLGLQIQDATKNRDILKRNEHVKIATALKEDLIKIEKEADLLDQELLLLSLSFPNDTHPDVPHGPEANAKILSAHGPRRLPAAPERDHLGICRTLELLDFEAGSVVTGSSWYYLLNEGALLEMALTNYALSVAIQNGFMPVLTPDAVRTDIAARCGFAPRERGGATSQMYHVVNSNQRYRTNHNPSSSPLTPPELVLTGTAEIPLAGMFTNKTYPSNQLPLKVVGVGHSFRTEAGASAESRGLYRVHQFTKVELFAVTTRDQSEEMMESMLEVQKKILKGLDLPFRALDMPTEELGASAYRKYDIQAWMPGRDTWGEVSSLSNCTDYQSRRLHIRYRPLTPKGTTHRRPIENLLFAHTLNGTAAAIPRLIVALLENGVVFGEDGRIKHILLPAALKPFWIDNQRNLVRWKDEF